MGQDIHAFLETVNEKADGTPYWWTVAELHLSRDRHMQWMLGSHVFEWADRGLPADVCEFTLAEFHPERGHYGASYCTAAEYSEAIQLSLLPEYEGSELPDADWLALQAMMQVYGEKCRLVFWFSY